MQTDNANNDAGSDAHQEFQASTDDTLDFESPFSWRTSNALEPFGASDSGFVSSRAEAKITDSHQRVTYKKMATPKDARGRGMSASSNSSSSSDVDGTGLVELRSDRLVASTKRYMDLATPSSPQNTTLADPPLPPHHNVTERFSSLVSETYPNGPGDASHNPPPFNIDDIEWYHYNISRHVAESILISTGEDGSYLLRDSASNPGEFTLSVRAKHTVKHFPVRWDGMEFSFGFGRFSTVAELREHFASRPVIGGQSGVLTLLKFPYPRCVEEPETYDMIRVHAEWGSQGNQQEKDKESAPTFAIASKEGYLTKLGQHRKTWKVRWFVLLKNELSYYKTREEKTPIRTINFKDVIDVTADDVQGRQNCLKVITSYRTFFMFASSAQEAEDWIKILKWKLDHPSGTEATTLKHC